MKAVTAATTLRLSGQVDADLRAAVKYFDECVVNCRLNICSTMVVIPEFRFGGVCTLSRTRNLQLCVWYPCPHWCKFNAPVHHWCKFNWSLQEWISMRWCLESHGCHRLDACFGRSHDTVCRKKEYISHQPEQTADWRTLRLPQKGAGALFKVF